MCSSASSTDTHESRFDRLDRAIARSLVLVMLAMTPMTASAGDEFGDANNTSFDESTVSLDNSQAGQTTFSIDTQRTVIGWQDLQQPNGNTLEFNFNDSNSIVLNTIGAQHPSNLNGSVISNGTVAFANPFGIFIGDDAVIDVGSLVAIGANVSRENFMTALPTTLGLTGTIENNGLIRADQNVSLLGSNIINNGQIISDSGHVLAIAGQGIGIRGWDTFRSDSAAEKNFWARLTGGTIENHGTIDAPNAALFAGRVRNFGEIEIDDGSLLMVATDAVWVTEFDNPVLIKIPNSIGNAPDDASVEYAIENHGRIDAGLGHVRLTASDPLGFAIRQGHSESGVPASIAARRIELEGGEIGRVHLSGTLDANDLTSSGVGGEIDITGSMIVLEDATIQASGTQGGGTIQIGGEQEGRGELQRARVAIVDADTTIRADATDNGDGGRVIVFAEDLTSIDGHISARGGSAGGDGGFVETSGLRHFAVNSIPDVGAPRGAVGSWLIDPFNITVSNTAPNCPAEGVACLNKAIEAILAPSFDDVGFDGILRTVDPDDNIPRANFVSADLIAEALATGTNLTISTQAFGLEPGDDVGNIDILDDILIESADVLDGTVAILTLLAAGDINVDSDIRVNPVAGRNHLALTVELHANDSSQTEAGRDFGLDLIEGDINLNGDIVTGGGDVVLNAASVIQQAGQSIVTDGGRVDIRTGLVRPSGSPFSIIREEGDPTVDPMIASPLLEIGGGIDTRDTNATGERIGIGGEIVLVASSINVRTVRDGLDAFQIVPGQLNLTSTSTIQSGGGDITLSGGSPPNSSGSFFAGSVDIDSDINSDINFDDPTNVASKLLFSPGGDIAIIANHVGLENEFSSIDISFPNPSLGQGGVVDIDADVTTEGGALSIGNDRTQSIQLDGTFSTTQAFNPAENGLIRLVALDTSSVDTNDDEFGTGEVILGAASATTLSSSAISINSRDVTFSEGAGANPVVMSAFGSSTATLATLLEQTVADSSSITSDEIQVAGSRQIIFNQNVELSAESIRITAASSPNDLNAPVEPGLADELTRLIFEGANGAGQSAANGVRLNADEITIAVGDGTTTSGDGFFDPAVQDVPPSSFGLRRLTRGAYDGLQLRGLAGVLRPEELQISQDGDFTITSSAPTEDGQLDLAGAFGGVAIGINDLHTTLESSDGVLTIEDAAALNNDGGLSFVVLNGGLFLPVEPNTPTSADDTVVFGDGAQALGVGGTTAFDVESLTVSTPGNLTVDQQLVDSIADANELVFEAGRNTGVASVARRGTLTVESGIVLQLASGLDRLALLAGASGFGDLVFAGAGTTLAADDLELRAGAGIDTENDDTNTLARITGLTNNVTIRDAGGGNFGEDLASTAVSFEYRQDAAIDAETDLPTLAQFGLTAAGFRSEGDVEYRVRSDRRSIDLNDGLIGTNEADRFRNSAISLIGVERNGDPAIDVSSEFAFEGKRVELGAVGDFEFTQRLANAFNRSGNDPDEEITLHSGLGETGDLSFDGSVTVKAPRINLIAGPGLNPAGGTVTQSSINVGSAKFDLGGASGATPTFVFHTNSLIDLNDLPDDDQFQIGLNLVLPDILAIRSDITILEFENFRIGALPLDVVDDPGRLILEAESIELTQTDGDNLDLTLNPNVKLRLRTNNLLLRAQDADVGATDDALVLIGAQPLDTQPLAGTDDLLDNESLLIEAFDRTAESATVQNSSSASEDPNDPDMFDLTQGRGPTTIAIRQDGAVTPNTLFNRNAVSGRLARSAFDDEDGLPIATRYTIDSRLNSVHIAPENVNDSNLVVSGVDDDLSTKPGILFDADTYTFESLSATTEDSIFILDGTQISATNSLALAAALLSVNESKPGLIFGSLVFEDGAATTSLSANKIELTAGPSFVLDNPDSGGDGDLDPDLVPDNLLPEIDFTGLDAIILTGDAEDSLFDIRQSQGMNTGSAEDDFITPLTADPGTAQWSNILLNVVQGDLSVDQLDVLASETDSLTALTSNLDSALVVNVPDGSIAPFDDFLGRVEIQSNDMTFRTTDINTSINLASDKLSLISTEVFGGFPLPTENERSKLRSDPDVLDRPIVRIEQPSDLGGMNSALARPGQYFVIDIFGERVARTDLSGIDIELKTTAGADLTFDNNLRASVTGSNLILNSAGDVDIALDGLTPGTPSLPDVDPAALQLTSFHVITGDGVGDGTITISPINIPGTPDTTLSIETTGDQQYDGNLVLDTTLLAKGRNIAMTGNITQVGTPTAGLRISTFGGVVFGGDIGDVANPIDHLLVSFDSETTARTPNVEFGGRIDVDGDGVDETAVASDQSVWVTDDIIFTSYRLSDEDRTGEILNAFAGVTSVSQLEDVLNTENLGRDRPTTIATVGKALGNLEINSVGGHIIATSGEKISVGGTATLNVDIAAGLVGLGDASALDLIVAANEIGLIRRKSAVTLDRSGETQQDAGPTIAANSIDFGSVTPQTIGSGRSFRFAVPNAFDQSALPDFLDRFPLFELKSNGKPLTTKDFRFAATTGPLATLVPSIQPTGASRSDLSGAFGPRVEPRPDRQIPEIMEVRHPEKLLALAVDAQATPIDVRLARLEGAAVIDDLEFGPGDDMEHVSAMITSARLDANDADAAIALYEELFGPDGERSETIRGLLQEALDLYLANTRTRRVVGFELRRFVKNRPSTLLDAYTTLESLDRLFRYHRRLGLSPGEYRRIQLNWLEEIQPDGITLDELSEAIHPSRYVRGSDILDIFGR